MTTQEAIDYYGGDRNALARALGVWVTATYQWGVEPPLLRQYQLEKLSNGKLTAENADHAGR